MNLEHPCNIFDMFTTLDGGDPVILVKLVAPLNAPDKLVKVGTLCVKKLAPTKYCDPEASQELDPFPNWVGSAVIITR